MTTLSAKSKSQTGSQDSSGSTTPTTSTSTCTSSDACKTTSLLTEPLPSLSIRTGPSSPPSHKIHFGDFRQQRDRVFKRMERYGGAFAKHLAYAMEAASYTNQKAIFDIDDIYYCAIEKYLDGTKLDVE